MTEQNGPPVPEPKGCAAVPGFVKSRPENNKYYLDQFKDDPWYPILVRTDERLEEMIPGYNVAQIKEKFGGLRYYIDMPETIPVGQYAWNDTEDKVKESAYAVIRYAEAWVDGFEYCRSQKFI